MIKYLVLTYHPWDAVQLNSGLPLDGASHDFGSGFLCVFDTKEEALKYWPEKEVHAIRFANVPKETAHE